MKIPSQLRALLSASFLATSLAGCITMSGNYTVTAIDANGKPSALVLHMQGSQIYSARNALCARHPGGTVMIKHMGTDKELTSDSPYKCRTR